MLQPRDETFELTGNRAGVPNRVADPVRVERRAPAVTRDFALDQLPKRDAHGRGAEGNAVRSPGLVAHLDAGHTVARGS